MTLLGYMVLLLALFVSPGWTHPVAYQGSKGVMTEYMPERTDIMVNYSFTPRLALGANYTRIPYRLDEAYFGVARLNALLYRANHLNSQGNVYAYAGGGVREYGGDESGAAFFGGEADWESRQYYVSFRSQSLRSPDRFNFDEFRWRAGIAPYVADFDALHSWLIAQVVYAPSQERDVSIAPVLRMFYRNVLWETGVSTRGDWLFNTITHF